MSDTHAHAIPFVRETEIPQQPAPLNAAGPVKWTRDNLFATWQNGLLTIVSAYIIYLVLSAILPWIWHGVWTVAFGMPRGATRPIGCLFLGDQ